MSGLEIPALVLAGISAGAGVINATKSAKDLAKDDVRLSFNASSPC